MSGVLTPNILAINLLIKMATIDDNSGQNYENAKQKEFPFI